jgi:hypothetical protein
MAKQSSALQEALAAYDKILYHELSCSENKAASDRQHPAGTLGRQDDGGPYYTSVIEGERSSW